MDWQIILAQAAVVAVNAYIASTERRVCIYIATFLFNAASLVMYLINGDPTTAIVYVSITIRSLVYIFRDKITPGGVLWHLIPSCAIAAQLIIGWNTIETAWHLIPILVPAYVCWYMWYDKNLQRMRIDNAICNGLWGLYNLHAGLYIVFVARVITVLVNLNEFRKRLGSDEKETVAETADVDTNSSCANEKV